MSCDSRFGLDPFIPAQAGIQKLPASTSQFVALGPRLRGDERRGCSLSFKNKQ
jgi:hypothetical protein